MKRSAAQIGLTCFSVLAAAFYLSDSITLILMLTAAAAALVFFLIPKTRKTVFLPLIALTAAVSCGVNLAYTAWAVDPVVTRYTGEEQEIEAVQTDESYRLYSKYCYPLKAVSIDGESADVKLLLKSDRPLDIEPFDHITFTADIGVMEKSSDKAKGYYLSVNAHDLSYTVEEGEDRPLYYHIIRLRQSMRDALEDLLPQDAAHLCEAVLIGDKYVIGQSVKDDFRYSGASYLIVVSGMHFAIVCLLSLRLFQKLFRKRFIYFPMTYLVIVLYMLITGFQPSVMRAGVMMLILVTGKMIRRQSDPLSSLGIAGLCMPIIFSPYGCGDIGMILSFAATFAIIMWHTPLYERIRIKHVSERRVTRWCIKITNAVLNLISVSLAANILVLPLSVFIFNGFSTVFLLSALLLYPLIWLMMIFALAVCAFYYLGPLRYLALLISWPLYGAAKLTLYLVHAIASIPFAYIHVRAFWFYLWVGITLVLGLTAYFLRKRLRLYRAAALLSAILFLTGTIVNTVIQINTDDLYISPGKTGLTVYLNRRGAVYLFRFDCDSSSAYQMLYRLTDACGGADFAVCTGYTERINYSRMTEKEFPLTHYLEYRKIARVYGAREPDEVFAGDSDFTFDDGLTLYTVESGSKELLYLADGDTTVMLIPTNFPYDAIPADMRRADIIFINKALKDYQKLSCDTLYYCGDTSTLSDTYFPEHDTLYDSSDGEISLDLR